MSSDGGRHGRVLKAESGMQRKIDYYFSMVSPWAYIGHAVFSDVARAHNCAVVYRPVSLGELFSDTGGLPLAKRHPLRQKYRLIELQRWRERRKLPLHLKPAHWPFDVTLADCTVIAMIEAGHDPDAFLRRAFPAVWEEQRDLGDAATLAAIADKVGLPGAEIVARASDPHIMTIYEKNRDDAMDTGVFGSPAYVLDGEVFWGQDRIEFLADALASKRPAFKA
jgi:2-hydroxychromene-2-carboxylate isomerase